MTPACLMHGSCLRTFLAQQDGVQQLWPRRLSLTQPHDDFNLDELLSDLATIARMIRCQNLVYLVESLTDKSLIKGLDVAKEAA